MTQPNDPTYAASPPPPGYQTPPPIEEQEHLHAHKRTALAVIRWITYFVYGLIVAIEIILALGFILLLLGANPSSSFVEWWYRNLDRVMEPFRGIFTPIELGITEGNNVPSVFETSVLFAMIIYAIVGLIVYAIAQWFTSKLNRLDIEDREYHARIARERQAEYDRQTAERAAYIQAGAQPPPTQQHPTQQNPPPPPQT